MHFFARGFSHCNLVIKNLSASSRTALELGHLELGICSLLRYGYDQAKLHSERAKIAAFESANQAQEAAKGAAHQATREKDAALAGLREWLAQYIKIAKVALRDKKQLFEKLDVLTGSGGRPTKKPTEQKPATD